MFLAQEFRKRRENLVEHMESGLVLLMGNRESPMNYPDNTYEFRQDGTFRYFFGIDKPGFAGLIDVDSGTAALFGEDLSLEDVVWMGHQPSVRELGQSAGLDNTGDPSDLQKRLVESQQKGRKIHILPPYRGETEKELQALLKISPETLKRFVSEELIVAVVALRNIKSDAEVSEIERAMDVTYEMHEAIAGLAHPGVHEFEIVGCLEGILGSRDMKKAYPIICSVHGEILHNHHYQNQLKRGNLLIADAGAQSPEGYATDITRTFPVGGHFSRAQKDIYDIVYTCQTEAIEAIAPGKPYREVHLQASLTIARGLKDLGFLKGNPEDAVHNGSQALFFPHGLGHMLGMDVHDMEGLGENYVGYDRTVQRSKQFGLGSLRLAKALEAGNVLTVEPGIYFIPALMEQWKGNRKHREFIDFKKAESFTAFGGIRIEDDVLVTPGGKRVLGKAIPKTWKALEEWMESERQPV